MGLLISTNVASLHAQRMLNKSEDRTAHAMRALASGSRITSAGDDAAGYAISESLRGQARSLRQAKQNSENATGLIQVAEGGLSEQNNILVRLRELAIQSASDTVGDDEREFLDTEFQQLVKEFDRIAKTTTYGQKKLLTGTNEVFEFQLGPGGEKDVDSVRYKMEANTTASAMRLDGMSVTDQDDAQDLLEDIDKALHKIAQARSGFGAMQSRLQIASGHLDVQYENVEAARSRIADADVAFETSELVQGKIQQEFGVAVLAQANARLERALKLLL